MIGDAGAEQTAAKVQAAIDNLRHDYTLVIIAHRLSTIQNADNIIVLDDGRVVESGKHKNLLADKGLYWKLYTAQKEEEEA